MAKTYDASDLTVLRGLEPVRQRPGMYTDCGSPDHIVREAVDNAVDEALAGHASSVSVELGGDGQVSVRDDGRGMPVDIHPEEGVSGVELILTRLHAGGKFSEDGGYGVAGGLHGVGISVANALSTRTEVEVRRKGRIWQMQCENGEPTGELKNIGKCARHESGTTVTLWPDPKYFDNPRVDPKNLARTLRAKALLCRGLTSSLKHPDGRREEWKFENGLEGIVSEALDGIETVPEKAWTASCEGTQGARVRKMQWSLAWVTDEGPAPPGPTESYVNLIPTPAGGSHVQGMRSGIARGVRNHIEHRGLSTGKTKVSADDCTAGLRYIMSLHAHAPQFAGQTKERLAERSIAEECERLFDREIALWMAGHTAMADRIAECAMEAMQHRLKMKAASKRRKSGPGPRLPGKLTECTGGRWEDTELFLVEGDSAGGSCRQGRDRKTQAVLPLRGKIKNTWEVGTETLGSSETISDIATAIGVNPGSKSCEGLRYAKICILADADSDGLHIATLLVALFMRHFPGLIAQGHLYMALPPLYRIDAGKQVRYARDDRERVAIEAELSSGRGKVEVQRFKGLGEMDPEQLRETTLRPGQRRLLRITDTEPAISGETIDMLLAKGRAKERREWLENEGDKANII